jgi:hypothetical protein
LFVQQLDSKWCFWSTSESVENETPSVTAIVETLIAAPLYWWIAARTGFLVPLFVSVCAAPFVLLRSRQSIALGVEWAEQCERRLVKSDKSYAELPVAEKLAIWGLWILSSVAGLSLVLIIFGGSIQASDTVRSVGFLTIEMILAFVFISSIFFFTMGTLVQVVFPHVDPIEIGSGKGPIALLTLGMILGVPLGFLILGILIRSGATLAHLREGFKNLPRNFRLLTLCMSPAQQPELIPGVDSASQFSLSGIREGLQSDDPKTTVGFFIVKAWFFIIAVILFGPAWFYRLTIKSTAWFWWPLAFLGGDLGGAPNLKLVHWKIMGSLWAKTTILLSCASITAFLVTNLVFDGAMFEGNPLLTPLGYLLLIDWTPRVWQISAVAVSVLSIILVFLTNSLSGEYRIAQEAGDARGIRAAARKFDLLQRLARLRLLFAIMFWGLVGTHAVLYVNSQRCWFVPPAHFEEWTKIIYGTRVPGNRCAHA